MFFITFSLSACAFSSVQGGGDISKVGGGRIGLSRGRTHDVEVENGRQK